MREFTERDVTNSSIASGRAKRAEGVTATMVADAATPKSFQRVALAMHTVTDIPDNPYMAFGRDMEPLVARLLKESHSVLANDWLIAAKDAPHEMATPDGLSQDHEVISEIKTTGTDWESVDKVPARYHRQVQWQLHVTGATLCWFAFMLRLDTPSGFQPAWLEPKVFPIERDEKLIGELRETAHQLMMYQVFQSMEDDTTTEGN
jgi:hypothetical protein